MGTWPGAHALRPLLAHENGLAPCPDRVMNWTNEMTTPRGKSVPAKQNNFPSWRGQGHLQGPDLD